MAFLNIQSRIKGVLLKNKEEGMENERSVKRPKYAKLDQLEEIGNSG